MLAPSIRAIDLRISPQGITLVTCNSFKKFEDGLIGMKHPERCSLTIPNNLFENKLEVVANLSKQIPVQDKGVFGLIIKINGRTWFDGRGRS
jgi:hypothetical protein